ncbi:hypothetical protein B0G82_0282 [Paraburkholderia sp. BL17N1]|nr:hypothetical protein B0G82_0282 [Paraburkholderia sp. BL17N1]
MIKGEERVLIRLYGANTRLDANLEKDFCSRVQHEVRGM